MIAKSTQAELEEKLKNDDRDVADLWKEALKSYESIVGFGLQRKFDNVESMLDFGVNQMNNFHKFRHDKGKVDRLRTLFSSNLDLVEQGANQIIAAAAPAFPPAAAIGTALTYMLQACRSVSADYDIIIVFFEDMNSFLTRITILETRLPKYKAYQNCLMEVFTSLLTMCGFAHKYIELGRFKKWISNLLNGGDGELSGARAKMNKNLEHLQQATEFAILSNTEESLKMASQLDDNQRSHAAMLERVGHTIDTIQENTENIKGDIAKILKLFGGQKKERGTEKPQAKKPATANSIRNAMPVVFNDGHEYQTLKETILPDSCGWVFSEPEWEEWLKLPDGARPILALTAEPGSGKSHLAAAVHDKLTQRASDDESGNTCVAHFYFREQEDAFAFFLCGVITVVNQIAESNHAACERLNAQIARDDIEIDTDMWQHIVEHLLGAVFGPDSKSNLFIVFDGLDELRDPEEFHEFLSGFYNDKRLKISLVVTSRPEQLDELPKDTRLIRIKADKDKQSQDLRALVWNRINSMNNLKGFSRYVQQRVADTIEEVSPNMLYAEHLLARLDNLGREGAALRALGQEMPKNLHDIYSILLAECQRRMPTKHQEVSATLLHWVTFSRRLLTLAEVQSLLKYLAQDSEFDIEEIREVFDKFLRVGGPGYDTEVLAQIEASQATAIQDLKQDEQHKHDSIYDDGPLPVTFKERSMRHYFTTVSGGSSEFRWGPSEANRRILLTSAELLRSHRGKVDESLLKYSALFLISHFIEIDADKHTSEEKIEVLKAFSETMANKTGLAEMLKKAGVIYGGSGVGTSVTNEKVAQWAKFVDIPEISEKLDSFTVEWWRRVGQDPPICRLDIAKGFLRQLYQAQNSKEAVEAYKELQGVLNAAGLTTLLMDQAAVNFPQEFKERSRGSNDDHAYKEATATLGVLNLFNEDLKPDAAAYRAVAEVLEQYGFINPAEKTSRRALELCKPTDHEWYRAASVLSQILLKQKKRKKAFEVANAAVNELSANNAPPPLKRTVFATYARTRYKLGQLDAALDSFAKAKASDPDGVTSGEDLVDELKVTERKADKTEYIQMLKQWSLVERITWIASDYADKGEERHALFCDIASETGEQGFIVNFYEEAIDFLDNLNAALPLRLDLATIYFEVCQQPGKALEILDKILDSRATGFRFPILGGTALWMMTRAVDCMTNVQLELFRKSRDPVYKAERLVSQANFMQRPLSLDVPRTSPFWMSSHRVGLAYMYLIMGPLEKFQEKVQSLLDDCFAGLNDTVGWNDAPYLWMLAQTLALMSKALRDDKKLRQYARIAGSAILSRIVHPANDNEEKTEADGGKDENEEAMEKKDSIIEKPDKSPAEEDQSDVDTSDEEEDIGLPPSDEGDLLSDDTYYTCGGFCNPERKFRWWGNRSAYLYVTFASGMICEECQAECDAVQRGERPFKGRHFYGIGQDKLKLPIEGWRGVKDGVIRIEGEEDIKMDDFLKKLETEVCKDSWERIWAGDAF